MISNDAHKDINNWGLCSWLGLWDEALRIVSHDISKEYKNQSNVQSNLQSFPYRVNENLHGGMNVVSGWGYFACYEMLLTPVVVSVISMCLIILYLPMKIAFHMNKALADTPATRTLIYFIDPIASMTKGLPLPCLFCEVAFVLVEKDLWTLQKHRKHKFFYNKP